MLKCWNSRKFSPNPQGIIKEIKGDLICIVYGKHMKWLKKNSRQLRPKAQQVKAALQSQSQSKQISAPQSMAPKAPQQSASSIMANAPPEDEVVNGQIMASEMAGPPPAFAPQFQPPPPSDPPPAFAMEDAIAPPPPPQEDIMMNGHDESHKSAKPDEFDYDVTFTTSVLGLELYPDRDGKNCIVGKCLRYFCVMMLGDLSLVKWSEVGFWVKSFFWNEMIFGKCWAF